MPERRPPKKTVEKLKGVPFIPACLDSYLRRRLDPCPRHAFNIHLFSGELAEAQCADCEAEWYPRLGDFMTWTQEHQPPSSCPECGATAHAWEPPN
jgi:hypothetical protein